ncbi:homoserine kinase [Paenibacillus yanchengensis]|uniref:Homoserine kinase n=1 Tax=Paenibacillus yanchengensis TaxID=2035833 RepID=A0ABW4YLQ4_9BACL
MKQINQNSVLVRVPASTANLGPGFDTLGMALSLYAWLEISVADTTTFEFYGEGNEELPKDKSNLIYKVAQMVFLEAGVAVPDLHIKFYSDIPLTRGLGSSATAIIAALIAANALIDSPLSDNRLFQIATALEGHPDNVGASMFGGIVVAAWDGEKAEYVKLTPPSQLTTLVVIPEFHLATEKARQVIPDELEMADAVFNVGRSSLLVAALATGQLQLLAHAMQDRLHQPYRTPLIPGMSHILEQSVQHGALGVALSGAGPTIITFVDRDLAATSKNQLERFLLETLSEQNITASTHWLDPCNNGSVVMKQAVSESLQLPFLDRIKGEINV